MSSLRVLIRARISAADVAPINGSLLAGDVVLLAPSKGAVESWLSGKLHGVAARPSDGRLAVGDIQVDLWSWQASREGTEIDLTPQELRLLAVLAGDTGRAWSFEDLMQAAWGRPSLGDTSAIRWAIKRLRRKLLRSGTEVRIQSVRGYGFRLVAPRSPGQGGAIGHREGRSRT